MRRARTAARGGIALAAMLGFWAVFTFGGDALIRSFIHEGAEQLDMEATFLSMGNAISIIVGQLLGAGELERAVDEDRKLIAFSIVLCAGVGVVMGLFAPLMPRIYNTSDTVRGLASQLIVMTAAFMPAYGFTNACYFTLRAGGQSFITFLFDSCYQWTLVVPLAFVLSRYTTLPLVPMSITIECMALIKCVLGCFFVKRRKWVKDLVNG